MFEKCKQTNQTADETFWKNDHLDSSKASFESSPSSRLPYLPARLTLFGEIKVGLTLKDRWLPRKVYDCADFS